MFKAILVILFISSYSLHAQQSEAELQVGIENGVHGDGDRCTGFTAGVGGSGGKGLCLAGADYGQGIRFPVAPGEQVLIGGLYRQGGALSLADRLVPIDDGYCGQGGNGYREAGVRLPAIVAGHQAIVRCLIRNDGYSRRIHQSGAPLQGGGQGRRYLQGSAISYTDALAALQHFYGGALQDI